MVILVNMLGMLGCFEAILLKHVRNNFPKLQKFYMWSRSHESQQPRLANDLLHPFIFCFREFFKPWIWWASYLNLLMTKGLKYV